MHYVDKVEIRRLSRSPSPFVDFDESSLRAWRFFLHSTATQLQGPFPAKIWSECLTRLAHSNGAIKHGIVALASLHENFMSLSDPDTSSIRHVLALEHYGKSIREVVYANQRDPQSAVLTTLVSSLLFCAIESVQGHMSSALKHISAGLGLLADHRDTVLMEDSEENREFPGFALALQEMFFNLAGQSLSYEERLIMNNSKLVEYLRRPRIVAESPSISIEKAAQELTGLFNDILLFQTWVESRQDEVDFPGPDLAAKANELHARYEGWIQIYHELLATSPRQLSSDSSGHQALLELRVNQLICRICLNINFDHQTQTVFDQCRSEFEAVVQVCEDLMMLEARSSDMSGRSQSPARLPQLSFRMSLGIVPALLFTCTKCRDQRIRYQALQVLKGIRRRECIWDSDVVSMVAEQFVKIEERLARKYWQQNLEANNRRSDLDSSTTELSIPEIARIHSMIVELPDDDDERGRASVAFLKTGDPDNRRVEYLQWED